MFLKQKQFYINVIISIGAILNGILYFIEFERKKNNWRNTEEMTELQVDFCFSTKIMFFK